MRVAYFKCLCRAVDKQIASRLRAEGIEVRDIRQNKEWRIEARQYGIQLPILVTDGKATPLRWT